MPLATNWRQTANYYISEKDGLDSNSGTTQSLPKKTIQNAVALPTTTSTFQIRTGFYQPTSTITAQNFTTILTLQGDGDVVVDGSLIATLSTHPNNNAGAGFLYRNMRIQNVSALGVSGVNGSNHNFYQCILHTLTSANFGGIQECLLINCNINRNTAPSLTFAVGIRSFRNTFIATVITSSDSDYTTYLQCAFDTSTTFTTTLGTMVFNNCAFEVGGANDFRINGVNIRNATITGNPNPIGSQYTDGQKFSGTATIGGQTITFTNCFWSASMGWNSKTNSDYTLSASPLSILHNAGTTIGAYGTYVRFDATHSAFNPLNTGVVIPGNVTVSGGTFQLTSGTEATIVSTDDPALALTLPYYTYLTNIVQFFGAFNYPNGDWVDRLNYANPSNLEVRLTYRLRIYNELTLAWGSWYELETFTRGSYDSSGRGNGDVDCTLTALNQLLGKIFQVEFTIRNNGV